MSSSKIRTTCCASYDAIKKLANKLHKLQQKQQLIDIINIITTLNPTVVITSNAHGIFIKFNTLTDATYATLENYLQSNTLDSETGTSFRQIDMSSDHETDTTDMDINFYYEKNDKMSI
jgi:hypothetical protein